MRVSHLATGGRGAQRQRGGRQGWELIVLQQGETLRLNNLSGQCSPKRSVGWPHVKPQGISCMFRFANEGGIR